MPACRCSHRYRTPAPSPSEQRPAVLLHRGGTCGPSASCGRICGALKLVLRYRDAGPRCVSRNVWCLKDIQSLVRASIVPPQHGPAKCPARSNLLGKGGLAGRGTDTSPRVEEHIHCGPSHQQAHRAAPRRSFRTMFGGPQAIQSFMPRLGFCAEGRNAAGMGRGWLDS